MKNTTTGYKAFNEGMTNRYGKHFEVGKLYTSNGKVTFGNNSKCGFHFCQNIEDTFRYFDAMSSKIDICSVSGYGEIVLNNDEYNGYYDMYSASHLFINKKLSRTDIINLSLKMNNERLKRFVSGFKLTNDEIDLILKKEKEILSYIEYYQLGMKDAFEKKLK